MMCHKSFSDLNIQVYLGELASSEVYLDAVRSFQPCHNKKHLERLGKEHSTIA